MIVKLLLNTRMIWMIFIKLLKNTIQNKKREILIVFNDMIADMFSNKKLLIRGRNLNISRVFIAQSYFAVSKKYWTKIYTLFYYKNSKQTRTSTNRIFRKTSFIRY